MKHKMKAALLSVSDKTNIIAFAQALHQLNIRILSTGGTAKLLQDNNIPVTLVSDYTGFPEIMNGRVKTLHPKIHAGLLARPTIDDAVLAKYTIDTIDIVAVNLYPFEQTVAQPDCDLARAIENIDIGGPTLLRAAAKNHNRVTVIVNPTDYESVLSEMQDNKGTTTPSTRYTLAQKVFAHTARYDTAIAHYLSTQADEATTPSTKANLFRSFALVRNIQANGDFQGEPWNAPLESPQREFTSRRRHSNQEGVSQSAKLLLPDKHHILLTKQQDLRYGENPHQQAAFYRTEFTPRACIASAVKHQGKALSFNNITDTDAARNCVQQFSTAAACVIVKHANPCGVAIGDTLVAAYRRAFATDPTSSFGGIIAFNQSLDAETAEAIISNQFAEVIIAPDITPDAQSLFKDKPNLRVLSVGSTTDMADEQHGPSLTYQSVGGGVLVQTHDRGTPELDALRVVTQRQPTDDEWRDLSFAWKVAKSVKSNAIVLAKAQATIGIGAGQMSRIDSTKIALRKAAEANLSPQGAVLASDAFFPFPDNVELAAKAGLSAIIQPGGSIRDKDVIAKADALGLVMVLTGVRHFLH